VKTVKKTRSNRGRLLVLTVVPALLFFSTIAGAMMLLNKLPGLIQRPSVQSFDTIEDAEQQTGLTILVPSYFPDDFSWPAATIEVMQRPALAVYMVFKSRKSGADSLWIYEITSQGDKADSFVPMPKHVVQVIALPLKGAKGAFSIGKSDAGADIYQVRWKTADHIYVVTTTLSLDDLISMAGSMIN
jgi:hypothetical protein